MRHANLTEKPSLHVILSEAKNLALNTVNYPARSLRPIPGLLTALVIATNCFLACSSKSAGGEDEKAATPADSAAEVTVTKVARADVTSVLTVTGTIAALPNRDAKVSSLVQGRIAGMMVAEGDHASQGQVLAKIEDRHFLDQIQQAQAAVEQAQANVENARLNRDRNEGLLERGIAARKDLEDARTQISVNQAALRQAAAARALARLQLARTEVRSPLAGPVVKRFATVQEQVDATALVVPAQAVYRDERGNPEVYRVEGDDASAVPVKLGLETKAQVELLSGVQAGDTVILTGGYGLKDHAKIKVREGG